MINLYLLTSNNKFIYAFHLPACMARVSAATKRLDDMLEFLSNQEKTKDYVVDQPVTDLTGITYLTKDPDATAHSPIILLLNDKVSGEKMRDAYHRATNKTLQGIFPLFHKDTYFRNAVNHKDAKIDIRNKDTLRGIPQETLADVIILSPAEKFVRARTPALKYFRPSDALHSTSIQTYTFKPVMFTPGPNNNRLEAEQSKRYFLPAQQ